MPEGEPQDTKTLISEIKGMFHGELKELQAKAHENGETLKELVDRDPIAKSQYEELDGRFQKAEQQIQELEKQAQRPVVHTGEPTEAKLDEAWAYHFKRADVDDSPDNRQAARDAFWAFVREGKENLGPDQRKLLSTQDNENGGYLVIPEFANEIIKDVANISEIRSVARVRTTSTGNFKIPKRTGRVTGGWVDEGATANRSTSTYGRQDIPNGALWAVSRATVEELGDSGFNLEEQMRMDITEEFAYREGLAFVDGDGVGKPEGLWTSGDVLSVPSGDAGNLTYQGLVRVSHGDATNGDVNPRYRRAGRFLMSGTTLGDVRLLEDTAGNIIYQPAFGESPANILGFPVTTVPDAPAVAGGAYPVMFGDIRQAYTIMDRVGVTMLRNPYSEDEQGIIRFTAYRRTGGQVVLPEAIRKVEIAS